MSAQTAQTAQSFEETVPVLPPEPESCDRYGVHFKLHLLYGSFVIASGMLGIAALLRLMQLVG